MGPYPPLRTHILILPPKSSSVPFPFSLSSMSVPCHHHVSSESLQQLLTGFLASFLPASHPYVTIVSFLNAILFMSLPFSNSSVVLHFLLDLYMAHMSSPGLDPTALAAVIPPYRAHSTSMPWHLLLPRLECPSPFAFLVNSYLPFNPQQKIYTFSLKPYPYCLPTGQVEPSLFLSHTSLCHTLQSYQMIIRTTNIQ